MALGDARGRVSDAPREAQDALRRFVDAQHDGGINDVLTGRPEMDMRAASPGTWRVNSRTKELRACRPRALDGKAPRVELRLVQARDRFGVLARHGEGLAPASRLEARHRARKCSSESASAVCGRKRRARGSEVEENRLVPALQHHVPLERAVGTLFAISVGRRSTGTRASTGSSALAGSSAK